MRAEEREVSFAVATITLFGTLAVFVYPFVGHTFDLPDAVFGIWTGIAVNDTSQVVAASSAYSEEARDVATVVKLVRNALMAPLIVVIAWWWQRQEAATDEAAIRRGIAGAVPMSVLGFVAFAALRTFGALDATQAARAHPRRARGRRAQHAHRGDAQSGSRPSPSGAPPHSPRRAQPRGDPRPRHRAGDVRNS